MLFATWEFFNPFFEERRTLHYWTSLLSCPHATSKKCSGPTEPRPAPSRRPAWYEPVAFEHSGDHGIFSPPGTGFLLVFRFSFRSVAALPALLVPRIWFLPLEGRCKCAGGSGLAGQNLPVCDRSPFSVPDKTYLVFSNYGYVVGMIQSVN